MQDATNPPPPPADPTAAGSPAFGPEQILNVMNAAVHLCQQAGPFLEHGLYVAIVAIPAANPANAEVVGTAQPAQMAGALEAVAAKIRKKFKAPGLVIPTADQAANLNGLRLRHEE